jgi:diaminohydroxyphosphoribosylaminopyrimidine deaminase/5-amino-6-(5-phosphoribosylamino)uracil reductase
LRQLIAELGRREMTNVLVEGGSRLLGSLFDQQFVDEVHVFIAPKLVGGDRAPGPLGGTGLPRIPPQDTFVRPHIEVLDQDVYITGRLLKTENQTRAN